MQMCQLENENFLNHSQAVCSCSKNGFVLSAEYFKFSCMQSGNEDTYLRCGAMI